MMYKIKRTSLFGKSVFLCYEKLKLTSFVSAYQKICTKAVFIFIRYQDIHSLQQNPLTLPYTFQHSTGRILLYHYSSASEISVTVAIIAYSCIIGESYTHISALAVIYMVVTDYNGFDVTSLNKSCKKA